MTGKARVVQTSVARPPEPAHRLHPAKDLLDPLPQPLTQRIPAMPAEWHGTTLFLDGLDEFRAGAADGRTPLDDIRRKLYLLGCPRFRLSCRWADWQAANDSEALEQVSPYGTVMVIQLDPLSDRNIKDILTNNHGKVRKAVAVEFVDVMLKFGPKLGAA